MSDWDKLFGGKELFGIKKSELRKRGYRTARQFIRGKLGLDVGPDKGDINLEEIANTAKLLRDMLKSPLVNDILKDQIEKQLDRLLGQ